jgi:hypothetical protein
MTATPVQTTLEERVLEWTETLCESLAENYKRYHRRMIERNSAYFNGDDSKKELSDYAQKQIDEMDNGTWKGMKFKIENGRKYYRIIAQEFDTFRDRNEYRDGSVMPLLIRRLERSTRQQAGQHPQSMSDMT